MVDSAATVWGGLPPSHILGRKLDSVPFSFYHVILLVRGFVGFIESREARGNLKLFNAAVPGFA
jgi:hypothetical protein